MKKNIFILLVTLSLIACQNGDFDKYMTKENIGAATGAIGGAWVGSNVGKGKGNVAAIAAGTLLGAYLGKSVGASLDKADLAHHNQTSQNALEYAKTGETKSWHNPDSGHSGTVTPSKTYRRASGGYCREFEQTIMIDGRQEEAYGNACRQPDGSWKIVK